MRTIEGMQARRLASNPTMNPSNIKDFTTQLAHLVEIYEFCSGVHLDFGFNAEPFAQSYSHVISLLKAWVHPKNLALNKDELFTEVGLAIKDADAFVTQMNFSWWRKILANIQDSMCYGGYVIERVEEFNGIFEEKYADLLAAPEKVSDEGDSQPKSTPDGDPQPVPRETASLPVTGAGKNPGYQTAQAAFHATGVATGAGMSHKKHEEEGVHVRGLG